MSEDCVNDVEWLAMLAEFRGHFWQQRVPVFLLAWEGCRQQPPAQWGSDLKRGVHGLAGVAAMVDRADVGDLARAIEGRWDERGGADEILRVMIEDLAGLLAAGSEGAPGTPPA